MHVPPLLAEAKNFLNDPRTILKTNTNTIICVTMKLSANASELD